MLSDGKLEARTLLCCPLEAQRALLCSLHKMSWLYVLSCILRYSLLSLYFFIPLWFVSPSIRFRITASYVNAARYTSLRRIFSRKYHHCYVRRSCNVIPRRPRPYWVETHRHADAGFYNIQVAKIFARFVQSCVEVFCRLTASVKQP